MIKSFILCAVFLLGMVGKTYAGTAKYTTITPPGRSSIVTSITGLLDVEETRGCTHFTVEGVIKSVDKGGFSLFVKESPFQKRDGSMTLYVNLTYTTLFDKIGHFIANQSSTLIKVNKHISLEGYACGSGGIISPHGIWSLN